MVAGAIANLAYGSDRKSDQTANLPHENMTQAKAAELLNVSERSVRAAVRVRNEGTPSLVAAVQSCAEMHYQLSFQGGVTPTVASRSSFKKFANLFALTIKTERLSRSYMFENTGARLPETSTKDF